MKRKTNKFLSLLLAFVMAFCLVPSAAAAGTTHDHKSDVWKSNSSQHWKECDTCGVEIDLAAHKLGDWIVEKKETCTEVGLKSQSCAICGRKTTQEIPKKSTDGKHSPKKDTYTSASATHHNYYCLSCETIVTEVHDWKDGKCTLCNANQTTNISVSPGSTSVLVGSTVTLTATTTPTGATVEWSSSDKTVATVSNGVVTGVKAGTATITATSGGKSSSCTVTVRATSTSTTTKYLIHPSSVDIDANSTSTRVSVSLNTNEYRDGYILWKIYNNNNSGYVQIAPTSYTSSSWGTSSVKENFTYASSSYYTASVYVRGSYSGSATLTAELYDYRGQYVSEARIPINVGYTNSNGYSLTPDTYTPSTSQKIYLYDDYRYDYNSSYYRYYQDFTVVPRLNGTAINTSDYNITYSWTLNNTPQSNSNSRTFTLRASMLNRSTNSLTCTAYINDKNTNSRLGTASITWSYIYSDYYYDGYDFSVSATVYDTTSKYNLNDKDDKNGSSIISQIADKLYNYNYNYNYGSGYGRDYISYVRFSNVTSSYGSLDASTSRDYYYDSYRSGSYDLRDVTFSPSKTGTASFDCTVHGTQGYSYKCTVNIKVEAGTTDKTASTINYSTTGTKSVTLSASDFTSRYKDVVGSSPSSLTIKFRNVPSNGTLKYNNTTLTSSNISSYEFSSSSSGSYRISDLTYTPKNNSSSTDTVDYYCYSGSTRRFSGSIKFTNTAETVTVPSGVTVSYSTTGASVTFSAPDFYNKHSAMLSASYIIFGSPTSGTLSSGGSAVSSGTKFGYTVDSAKGYKNLASVSYKPASGYNGTATIPFTAYNSDGTTAATGNVSILVSQTTTSTTTPTTPSNTSKTFKDVASTAWYATDVAALSAAGIVSGDNNGNFRPQDAVTYGEALKMVLIASGYPKQNELTGANWAQNYLTQAISNSILSGSASDYTLSKSINRTAMATVAAKALKLTPVTNAASSPYTDTSDSYVLALTNAGIVQGDASSGQTKWRGGDTLTRAEMSRIVYNIYKYRNVSLGGSSTSTDTSSKPDWLK